MNCKRSVCVFTLLQLICVPAISTAENAPSSASDAIVMVYPQDTWAQVVLTFAKETTKSDAMTMLQRVGKAGGWKLANLSLTGPDVNAKQPASKTTGEKKYTQITGVMSGSPIYTGGGFRLQPYLDALGGLDRFEVLFLTSPVTGFQGLFAFGNPQLQVDLLRDGNPYHYRIQVKDRSKPLPKLPVVQQRYVASVPPANAMPGAGAVQGKSGPDLIAGVMAAAAAGLFCMLALMWRQAARAAALDGQRIPAETTRGRKEIRRV